MKEKQYLYNDYNEKKRQKLSHIYIYDCFLILSKKNYVKQPEKNQNSSIN